MNMEEKILNKVLSARFHSVLKKIKHQDQIWFIPGLQTWFNIWKPIDIIYHTSWYDIIESEQALLGSSVWKTSCPLFSWLQLPWPSLSSKGQIPAEEKGSTKRRKEQPKNNSEALGQGLGSTSRDTYNNVTILHTRQGRPEATLKEPEKFIRKINWDQISGVFSSVQFHRSVMSHSLRLHGLQYARPPCPSPTPRAYSYLSPLSRWCHLTISLSVILFSSCLQSFLASGSFQMSQLFASGDKKIGVSASASVLPMNIKGWFPLGWTVWIFLQSKGLSRVFPNTTVPKYQFFGAKVSLYPTLTSLPDYRKSHSFD